jgi:membrane protease subunit HflK
MAKGSSPWGRKPGGTGGRPSGTGGGIGGGSGSNKPPFDKIWRDSHARMRGMMGGYGPPSEKRTAGMIVAALLLLWVGSGIYRVNSDEMGVVLRFGEYHRTTTPGLNYHLPYPIETVQIPSVTSVNKVEIGYRGTVAENPNIRVAKSAIGDATMGFGTPQNREGLMLTEDRNIVDIDFEVQWKIDASAPEKFLFNLRDPEDSVKAVGESAMREVIGRNRLEDILTTAQSQIAEDTRTIMQQIFDEYDAGIEIISVNLSRPDVPQPVIDEFQDVKRAEQNKETAESVAEGYRNEIIPQAKGEAAQMEQQALAYKSKVIADAQGDVARFNSVYHEYVQAKDVTKKRMYLETMEAVMKGMPKTIIDPAARGNGGTVQMLPVPSIKSATPVTQ